MSPKEPLESPSFLISQPSLWIFGYGSIIWKQGFQYYKSKIGYINGFVRRFWQGCVSHRGVASAPGRVATLVKQEKGTTWGVAFQLVGQEQIFNALENLNIRETSLGGYELHRLTFQGQDGSTETVLAYVATPENKNYVGPAEVTEIAKCIAFCKGQAGPNTEYLFRLVDFMRENLPHVKDDHLYKLEQETKNLLMCNNLSYGSRVRVLFAADESHVHKQSSILGRWQYVKENMHRISALV